MPGKFIIMPHCTMTGSEVGPSGYRKCNRKLSWRFTTGTLGSNFTPHLYLLTSLLAFSSKQASLTWRFAYIARSSDCLCSSFLSLHMFKLLAVFLSNGSKQNHFPRTDQKSERQRSDFKHKAHCGALEPHLDMFL